MSLKNKIRNLINIFKEKKYIPVVEIKNKRDLLKDKVALITGGSSGIGYAIAEIFIKHGCNVIIAGRNEYKLRKCCDELVKLGSCKYIVLDVLDINELNNKIFEASTFFDKNEINILVNSAGIVGKSSFADMKEEEYDSIMDINTKGTFFMCQYMSKYMIEHNIKGHILNISSSSALRPAWTAYEMSKWAIKGFTLGLADKLLPYGIIVNAIAPGPTATPMLGKGKNDTIYNLNSMSKRYAVPLEIANMALFLVSESGNMIVGDTIYMTGGSGLISLHH